MTLLAQPELRLPRLHRRDALGDISLAVHILGWDQSTIMEMVQSGGLLWTWNVASDLGGARAEWRFWIGELVAPDTQRTQKLDQVVECVVGKREMVDLSVFSVKELLRVSRQQVHRLIETNQIAGRISNHVGWVPRASLVGFLKNRWTGNL